MRLFIAVDLGEQIRTRVSEELAALRRLAPDAKWVRPESIHVTLAFLGYLPEERVAGVRAAIENTSSTCQPLSFHARGIGSFGSSRHPRVLWVGLEGDVELLGRAKQRLESELVPFGYEPEQRNFSPHLTLARSRNPSGDSNLVRCQEHGRDLDFGSARVDRLILYRSDLSPKGARYTSLFESRFRARDG